MNVLVGIWLLAYDEHFSKVHRWLVQTCCQSCADQGQCGGGMSCLMPFVFCNVIQVLLMVLLGGVFRSIIQGFQLMEEGTSFGLKVGLNAVSTLVVVVSMIVGSIYSSLAYRDNRDLGLTAIPGDSSW